MNQLHAGLVEKSRGSSLDLSPGLVGLRGRGGEVHYDEYKIGLFNSVSRSGEKDCDCIVFHRNLINMFDFATPLPNK